MIEYKTGSIFNTRCKTIVNTVNTVGVMGAGLALVHKMMFPKMFQQYKEYCSTGALRIGTLWLYQNTNRWDVLNFPTKRDWRSKSDIRDIESGLNKFCSQYKAQGLKEVAFPLLGCNNGGLPEYQVMDLMKGYLEPVSERIKIEIWTNDWETNPVWDELYEACKDGDTDFKKTVLECSCFEELVRMPGINKDTVGEKVNEVIKFEK
jgi:O-acetyl-ADP-ribose deacetylase (regulator of RNase III)